METKIKISIHSIAILLALDLQIPVCACHTAIAVETHHSVTKGSVILVKNVTFVMTELMAPAALVEMDSPPMKMALVINQAIPVVLVRALRVGLVMDGAIMELYIM